MNSKQISRLAAAFAAAILSAGHAVAAPAIVDAVQVNDIGVIDEATRGFLHDYSRVHANWTTGDASLQHVEFSVRAGAFSDGSALSSQLAAARALASAVNVSRKQVKVSFHFRY